MLESLCRFSALQLCSLAIPTRATFTRSLKAGRWRFDQRWTQFPRAATRPCVPVRPLTSAAVSPEEINSPPDPKPYYITTPIFYVNADPHLGHLYSMLLADVLKRWQELKGCRALFSTGTDEHGLKVQRAALAAKTDPQLFCDEKAGVFQELARDGDISYTDFIRTTEGRHKEAVDYFWQLLKQRDMIYLDTHEGWYSVSDECFFPESGVEYIVDRRTGRKKHVSLETGSEVEWTEEENYKFRLSAMREPLLEFYKQHPRWVVPQPRYEEVIASVEAGLKDLSISRPTNRLSLALQVPDDPSQTIYVWLDALINYITNSGYPWTPGKEHEEGWPADVHVIGKDITRFHCIHWPAFLMALNLPLPRQILAHPHWTLGNKKLSKSTGIIVNPFWAIDRFDADPLRFFLMHEGGIVDDAAYDNAFVAKTYRSILMSTLGNLLSRITRSKMWKLEDVTTRAQANFDSFDWSETTTKDAHKSLSSLSYLCNKEMARLNVRAAVRKLTDSMRLGNKLMQDSAPWDSCRSEDPSMVERGKMYVYLVAEHLRIIGILLQPVMPGRMAELLDGLGVSHDRRRFQDALLGSDFSYGAPLVELKEGAENTLFPPITID